MAIIELSLSMEVAGESMECDVYIPANGKRFKVLNFEGEAAFDVNAAVKLVWIMNHVSETAETLWSIKGAGQLPKSISRSNADGIRKLSLCLDNGLTGAVFLSGHARIWVEE